MNRFLLPLCCYLLILVTLGCGSSSGVSESTSSNTALFDPTTNTVPLPNVLATATGTDPVTQYRDSATGNVGVRPANLAMNPLEALAYVNRYEVGGTNAVSGVNSPIYIRFAAPLVPDTVNGSNIKVFQVAADSASPAATENSPLRFTDVTGMFTFSYTAGSSDVSLFPNFPLLPATRYVYLVTNRVLDAATGGRISGSVYFQALKSTVPLQGPFAPLEPIRANSTDSSGNVLFSGYAKTMNDLIAASSVTTVSSRGDLALLGRFVTTAAGFVSGDPVGNPVGSLLPVETALRAFAAGSDLPGGLAGKSWIGAGLNTVSAVTTTAPQAYWTAVSNGTLTAPSTVGTVVTGTIASADISMNPVEVHNHPAGMNLGVPFGTYSASTSVVQPFHDSATGRLTGYYYTPRQVPFVYLAPAGTAPSGGWPLVIFQHGINGQKEQVVAVAGALTGAGFAVVAIDLPLHGALAFPGHTLSQQWGEDFIALGAPLATRSNIQQAAFNLDRLELTLATPAFNSALAGEGFAPLGANAPNPAIKPKYVGLSLGSIVGAYYLAGNTTLTTAAGQPPYTQASLNADMKGLLNVPGGRLAYLIQESPDFSPSVNAALASHGILPGTPEYRQFFLLSQAVIDPADPATMTTPLPNFQSAQLLPSRLSGRIAVQEATSTSFSPSGVPLNGDLVIPNSSTRYFGNALGGRGVLGHDIAPGFSQLGYADGRIPALFMFTLSGGSPVPKTTPAATDLSATTPREGYFQFDQPDVTHAFLIDAADSPFSIQLAQRQMGFFLTPGIVVDPTLPLAAPHAIRVTGLPRAPVTFPGRGWARQRSPRQAA
ncbi:lysophospholipase VolA [Geomonas sp. Red276]